MPGFYTNRQIRYVRDTVLNSQLTDPRGRVISYRLKGILSPWSRQASSLCRIYTARVDCREGYDACVVG